MEKTSKSQKVVILTILLGLVFIAGLYIGAQTVSKYVISVTMELVDRGLIGIDINEQFLEAAIFQYRGNVNGCLFLEPLE